MTRYIDTQYLFKCETCRHYTEGQGCNTFCDSGECYSPNMNKIPTADVAPKSEVDRAYERGFERGKKNNVCGFSAEEIAQKAEKIAIELEAMRMAANSYKMYYENARVEVAREIFEEIEKYKRIIIEGTKPVYTLKQRELEELKKKYTEGEK